MAQPHKQTIVLHGITVEQTLLQGNWYTPVDERVKIAQHAKPDALRATGGGFHLVTHEIIPVGDRWAYTCVIEYPVGSGICTPGSDFIDTKDASGLAKAETSAIGRALGFHGIAIEGGIASAEEVERVLPSAQNQQRTQDAQKSQQAKQATATSQAATSSAEDTIIISETDVNVFRKACEVGGVKWHDVVLWVPEHAGHSIMECSKAELRRLYEILRTTPNRFTEAA